jgi:hypothetical protein
MSASALTRPSRKIDFVKARVEGLCTICSAPPPMRLWELVLVPSADSTEYGFAQGLQRTSLVAHQAPATHRRRSSASPNRALIINRAQLAHYNRSIQTDPSSSTNFNGPVSTIRRRFSLLLSRLYRVAVSFLSDVPQCRTRLAGFMSAAPDWCSSIPPSSFRRAVPLANRELYCRPNARTTEGGLIAQLGQAGQTRLQ